MLLEALEMLDVAEATPETEDEIDVDEEVDKVELKLGIMTADELDSNHKPYYRGMKERYV